MLPNPPNPPSPWRDFLANKIVLDIWGGTFTNIAANLSRLAGYGITNCVALIHDWQRSGYDNALPMHYPANAGLRGRCRHEQPRRHRHAAGHPVRAP